MPDENPTLARIRLMHAKLCALFVKPQSEWREAALAMSFPMATGLALTLVEDAMTGANAEVSDTAEDLAILESAIDGRYDRLPEEFVASVEHTRIPVGGIQ